MSKGKKPAKVGHQSGTGQQDSTRERVLVLDARGKRRLVWRDRTT